MSEWKDFKMGEVVKTNTSQYSLSENWNTIQYLDTGNITKNQISNIEIYFDNKGLPSRARRKVKHGDIIYSCVRPNLCHYGYLDNPPSNLLVSTGFVVITVKTEFADSRFIYYYLTQNQIVQTLHAIAEQSVSTYPSIKASDIESINVSLPPLSIQKKIASILSSLDDKIAVNKKICENLEAQAQTLFKHWFVDFAPFKDGKFVESELGMIPLSIICEQITDGVHNSVKDEPNSSYMLLSCKNIVGGVLSKNNYRSISKNTFDSLRLRTKLAKGDILISSVGTIGEIAIVEEDPLNYEFQRSVAIVKPKEKIGTYFLYNALLASKTRLQHAAHGAVQQCLFLGDLKKFKVNCYDIEKAFLYNETVKPLFEEIAKLHQESDRLSSLRDTLLPKLMSGQIKL